MNLTFNSCLAFRESSIESARSCGVKPFENASDVHIVPQEVIIAAGRVDDPPVPVYCLYCADSLLDSTSECDLSSPPVSQVHHRYRFKNLQTLRHWKCAAGLGLHAARP